MFLGRELADGAEVPRRTARRSMLLDQIFEQIDTGEMRLGGDEGPVDRHVERGPERDLEVELTDHVGALTRQGTATTHSPATQAFLSAVPYVRCRM